VTDTSVPTEDVLEEVPADDDEETQASERTHADARTMIFPEQRILFVPVPKAGCTAIMWSLAKAAGLDEDRFYDSSSRGQVSRSLTIHDLSRWPNEFLWAKTPQEQKLEILAADDWLRFTVVRHPFRRLWSAWQSKILLAEPQFVHRFSSQPWFPTSVESAADVLKAFRQFLEAIEEDADLVTADPHWAPQVGVASPDEMAYTHVGRVEKLGATVQELRDHLSKVEGPGFPEMPRENVTPLPFINELFTEADARILGDRYGDDLKRFDYEPPPAQALSAPPSPSWMEAIDAVMPAIQALRDRNERVGDLERVFKDRRKVLQKRLGDQRNRANHLQDRVDQQKSRLEEQKERLQRQNRLRGEEQRRNQRLQARLLQAQKENKRMKNSASWRYTAPLRKLSQLGRRALGLGRRK
jgi:hypothetical protein